MKSGGGSPRHDRLLDKDELKIDLDSFSHHGKLITLVYVNINKYIVIEFINK